jgi:hypothetical protein
MQVQTQDEPAGRAKYLYFASQHNLSQAISAYKTHKFSPFVRAAAEALSSLIVLREMQQQFNYQGVENVPLPVVDPNAATAAKVVAALMRATVLRKRKYDCGLPVTDESVASAETESC